MPNVYGFFSLLRGGERRNNFVFFGIDHLILRWSLIANTQSLEMKKPIDEIQWNEEFKLWIKSNINLLF